MTLIQFVWYFGPSLLMSIIIAFIFHYRNRELTAGYIMLYIFITILGPVGFIIGVLFIKDNFTKDRMFD